MLNITKEQFLTIYKDTPLVEYVDIFYSEPKNDEDVLQNFIISKLWRLNNLYTIIDKWGNEVRFNMNLAQHKVYAASIRHPRLIILKSRQQGISTLWLVSFFDDAITNKNFSIGLMAQGQDEASTLLTRIKVLWDKLDSNIKDILNLNTSKDNTKEFSLTNGSNIFIRTSFRSATLQRLHISEMGKIANKYPEKAQETKTGTLQAIAPGNVAVIESTAEGANIFKDMWDSAIKNTGRLSLKDFLPIFLPWYDDPDCNSDIDQVITHKHAEYFEKLEKEANIKLTTKQKNFWIIQFRELEDKIYQEYPSSYLEAFMKSKDGAYYARLYLEHIKSKGHERTKLYDSNLDVQIAFDLGMNDTMVAKIFQTYRGEMRIFDEEWDSGKPIQYYTDILKKKPYFDHVTRIILPHDAQVKELTRRDGKTRAGVFEEELPGILVYVLDRTEIEDGIETVRSSIPNIWIDPEACPYLIECFYNYEKEWDDKKDCWRSTPNHNKYSNGADCIRYGCIGADWQGRPRKAKKEYNQPYANTRGHDV